MTVDVKEIWDLLIEDIENQVDAKEAAHLENLKKISKIKSENILSFCRYKRPFGIKNNTSAEHELPFEIQCSNEELDESAILEELEEEDDDELQEFNDDSSQNSLQEEF